VPRAQDSAIGIAWRLEVFLLQVAQQAPERAITNLIAVIEQAFKDRGQESRPL
jgi:hypothetical protein